MEKIYESIIKFIEKPRTLPGLIINLEHHLGRSYSEKTSMRSRFPNSNRIPTVKEQKFCSQVSRLFFWATKHLLK